MGSFAETLLESAKNTPKITALSALSFIITAVLILTSWLKQRKLSGPGPRTLPIIGNFHQMAANIKGMPQAGTNFAHNVNYTCLYNIFPTVSMQIKYPTN